MAILLADDHELYRDGLKRLLALTTPEVEIVEADTFFQVFSVIESYHLDLILLDLHMPGSDGIKTITEVCQKAQPVSVILLTGDDHPLLHNNWRETGASAFLSKSADSRTIQNTIRNLLSGNTPSASRATTTPLQGKLSSSQKRLLALLVEGLSNREIAKEMNLSEGTVKQYVSTLFRVLEVENRTQAAMKGKEILYYH